MSPEFLVTSIIVVIAPGTGVLYTVALGLSRGPSASIVAAFGCTLGIIPHIIASIAGLAAILHTSAILFQGLKYAGAAYLLYLAWRTLKDGGLLSFDDNKQIRQGYNSIAFNGFLINILNPKLSIFFLAFLPQFIPAQHMSATLFMTALGVTFMAMTFIIFVFYGIFAAHFRALLLNRPKVADWMKRGIAGSFAILGLKLAMAER